MHLSVEGGSWTWNGDEMSDCGPSGSGGVAGMQCRVRRPRSCRAGCNLRVVGRVILCRSCNRSLLSAVSAPVAQRPERLAPPARIPHALGADVSASRASGRSGIESGSASQNLRGRASGEQAVQKVDSCGDPGDSSGCQNLAPRRLPLRPPRFCEAGDFPVILGERHSIEHVHVHWPRRLSASLLGSDQPYRGKSKYGG